MYTHQYSVVQAKIKLSSLPNFLCKNKDCIKGYLKIHIHVHVASLFCILTHNLRCTCTTWKQFDCTSMTFYFMTPTGVMTFDLIK